MRANVHQEGNVSVVDLPPRVVHGDGAGEIERAVQGLLDEGSIRILLNMEKLLLLDSTGISELITCHKRVTEKGGVIKVLKPSSKVLDLFTITGLASRFQIFQDKQQALMNF